MIEMGKNVNDKDKCSGCGACVLKCPKKAIKLIKDDFGNVYPTIDEKLCVNCGLCVNSCNFVKFKKNSDPICSYAAYTDTTEIIINSSSGGVFGSIAYEFLKNGGYVCGCSMEFENDELFPKHILINDIKDLRKIQGSKYVQSSIFEVLPKIKKLLNNDKKVLFSGSPCQVAGLKSFLGKDYSNLYTIDIICHGAPNKEIFLDYIKNIEKKKNVKINNVIFRDKKSGWGLTGTLSGFKLNSQRKFKMRFINSESSYYYLFQNGYLYRKNCYKCPFASNNRPAMITIGDYWGIEIEHPEIKVNDGISCVIVNDENGKNLLKEYGSHLKLFESSFEKIRRHNGQLNNPVVEPKDNKKIMNDYKNNGYESVEKDFILLCGRKNLLVRKLKTRIIFIYKFIKKKFW